MIISHSRRFVFVHIHKAGGTSVERALDPHLAWNDLILGGSEFGERIQAPYQKRFALNKHSTVSEIETVCGSRYLDEYFTFALVRHPVARVCSVYNFVATALGRIAERHKIALADLLKNCTPQMRKKSPALNWTSSRIFATTSGFSEFLRHPKTATVPGFRPQVSSLVRAGQDDVAISHFRLEDYPTWSSQLGGRLGLEFALPHANKSGANLVSPESVSADDRHLIESQYAADMRAFGYSEFRVSDYTTAASARPSA
jgi:hypothetical protein